MPAPLFLYAAVVVRLRYTEGRACRLAGRGIVGESFVVRERH
jgi:hypothetical protein